MFTQMEDFPSCRVLGEKIGLFSSILLFRFAAI